MFESNRIISLPEKRAALIGSARTFHLQAKVANDSEKASDRSILCGRLPRQILSSDDTGVPHRFDKSKTSKNFRFSSHFRETQDKGYAEHTWHFSHNFSMLDFGKICKRNRKFLLEYISPQILKILQLYLLPILSYGICP